MENGKIRVIVIQESVIGSWARDIFTFGVLLGMWWFNHEFLGDSFFFKLVALTSFFIFGFQLSTSKRFRTKEEAVEYLGKEENAKVV